MTRLTVEHAHNELQADGWIASRVGRGSFVTVRPRPEGLMAVVYVGGSGRGEALRDLFGTFGAHLWPAMRSRRRWPSTSSTCPTW